MADGKSAVGSMGVWGSLIAFGSAALTIVTDPSIAAVLPMAWNPYIGAVAAAVALIGRLKAKAPIVSVLPPKKVKTP
jgi:hypothetical protein